MWDAQPRGVSNPSQSPEDGGDPRCGVGHLNLLRGLQDLPALPAALGLLGVGFYPPVPLWSEFVHPLPSTRIATAPCEKSNPEVIHLRLLNIKSPSAWIISLRGQGLSSCSITDSLMVFWSVTAAPRHETNDEMMRKAGADFALALQPPRRLNRPQCFHPAFVGLLVASATPHGMQSSSWGLQTDPGLHREGTSGQAVARPLRFLPRAFLRIF